MRAEAFRQLQDPAPPRQATEFGTAPCPPDVVHELSEVLSRLVESQELLIREVREAARRPDAEVEAIDTEAEGAGDGRTVTYDWTQSPSTSPWD